MHLSSFPPTLLFFSSTLVRLTGSSLNTPCVCSLQACKKRVEQYSMDISNLHRQKTDVDHKLNVALKKKEDAEGYLKARTSEVEKLKKREQELLQKIAEVKKVLTQATCTFSLASCSHRRACANALRSSITFFTAAAALADNFFNRTSRNVQNNWSRSRRSCKRSTPKCMQIFARSLGFRILPNMKVARLLS